MSATTSASFEERVRSVLSGLPEQGLIDRYAANDVLLDLLGAAGSDDEEARVLSALASLPKSNLIDRSYLAGLLVGLSPNSN